MNGAKEHSGSSSYSSPPSSNSSPPSGQVSVTTLHTSIAPPSSPSISSSSTVLPHHRLVAYGATLELLAAVRGASIRDATLRDQALRSAKSACLNTAEGAARGTRPDQARVFTIARAEACEAAAAVEIAAAAGDAASGASADVNRRAARVVALLNGLIR